MHWPFKERERLSAPVDTPLGSLPQREEIRAPSSGPSPQSAATGLSQLDALSTPRGLRAQFESLHCCRETKEDEGPDLAKPNQNQGSGLEYSATPLCLAWARPTTVECGWRTPNSHDGSHRTGASALPFPRIFSHIFSEMPESLLWAQSLSLAETTPEGPGRAACGPGFCWLCLGPLGLEPARIAPKCERPIPGASRERMTYSRPRLN